MPRHPNSPDRLLMRSVPAGGDRRGRHDDESLIDVATAVSGSAPAYLYAFVEALEAAGEKAGLAARDGADPRSRHYRWRGGLDEQRR